MSVELRHGSERHQVTLPSEVLLGREATLNDLLEIVVNTTGITSDCVKMIFKGKTLPHDNTSLKVVGIADGSRIMILGKKYNPDNDTFIIAMRQIEVIVDAVNQQIESLKSEVDELMKGFLPSHLIPSVAKGHKKQQLHLDEKLTQLMEQLDSLAVSHHELPGCLYQLQPSKDPLCDEQQLSQSTCIHIAREKRKSCIQRIQGMLTILESIGKNVDSLSA